MTTRALSFGPVASAYERFRPGYPGELFERIRKVLPERVTLVADITLHLARLASQAGGAFVFTPLG